MTWASVSCDQSTAGINVPPHSYLQHIEDWRSVTQVRHEPFLLQTFWHVKAEKHRCDQRLWRFHFVPQPCRWVSMYSTRAAQLNTTQPSLMLLTIDIKGLFPGSLDLSEKGHRLTGGRRPELLSIINQEPPQPAQVIWISSSQFRDIWMFRYNKKIKKNG